MSFKNFQFNNQIQAALDRCGYVAATPIQEQAIEPVLKGRDLMGLAQTGTGKTAAFVLPILQRLCTGPKNKVRALIIAPTRELAEQTHSYIGKLAQGSNLRSVVVYGGVSKQAQINKIKRGVEIVVACPGRLLDLANDRAVNLSGVEMLVLDEADHMFDQGFLPDIRRIISKLPRQRQNLVFSATMPGEIRSLVEDILVNPVTVQVDHEKSIATISHSMCRVEQKGKTVLLKSLLQDDKIATALVFTRTKHKARSLALQLEKSGHKATALQGNMSQQKRQQALNGFKSGAYNILVATDIAARGIDVSNISHVINFDMPENSETYTHRTGRTGRACKNGEAITFATPDDIKMIKALQRTLGSGLTISGKHVQSQGGQEQQQEAGRKPAQRRAKPASIRAEYSEKMNKRAAAPRDNDKKRPLRGKKSSQRNRSISFDFGIAAR